MAMNRSLSHSCSEERHSALHRCSSQSQVTKSPFAAVQVEPAVASLAVAVSVPERSAQAEAKLSGVRPFREPLYVPW